MCDGSEMMDFRRSVCAFWCGIVLLLSTSVVQAAPPPPTVLTADRKHFEDELRPLLAKYCLNCHSGEKPKGALRLDNIQLDLADGPARAHWASIVERLRAGEMPPEESPRPTEKEIEALTAWLAPRVEDAEKAARAAEGRVVLRRLNRVEYENTVCDLLGIKVRLKEQLPEDGSADGFDTGAAAHHTSSFLLEKYLDAADTALNMAISNHPKPPPLVSKRYSL